MLVISPESACDVCLDQYSSQKPPASLKCGHCFCRSCIFTLGTRSCPICRQSFTITADLRNLHVDFMDSKPSEITVHERKALEAAKSGDVLFMEASVAAIDGWLVAQPTTIHSSLPVVTELVRLLIEATSQLHVALERAQDDEHSSKQRYQLDEMAWNAEKRRLTLEAAALREGLSRQRDHLAYLESELAKARTNPSVETLASKPSNPSSAPVPRPSVKEVTLLPSPVSPLTVQNAKPRPVLSTSQGAAPLTSMGATWPSRGVVLVDSPRPYSPKPLGRPPRPTLNGPRARTSALLDANAKIGPPPGAAPSAFITNSRAKLASDDSHDSLHDSYESVKRTSLPSLTRPEYMGSRSFDSTARNHRFSAQPTSWRSDLIQDTPASPIGTEETTSLPYLHSDSPRTQFSSSESPSLSRKRALRRQSKDIPSSEL